MNHKLDFRPTVWGVKGKNVLEYIIAELCVAESGG